MILKDMILNFIERYDLGFYNINKIKIYPILISSLSFVNNSLMISMFSFSTAKNNDVL